MSPAGGGTEPTIRLRAAYQGAGLASLPLMERLYRARGVASGIPGYTLDRLDDGQRLKNLDAAAAEIAAAVMSQQRIVVAGDYDVDGATSTALAVLALRACGARVDWVVPDRFSQGYGLSPALVEEARRRYRPDLLITVDNGVAAHEGIRAAQAASIRVVVTDHHLPPAKLPPADVMVNPNLTDCLFPWKATAGVGVVFYVLAAVRRLLEARGWYAQQRIARPALAQWLDLVALGTVADVVALDDNNRILVWQGLSRIRAGLARPGLLALLRCAGVDVSLTTAADLSFQVAPRLNAAGRLQHIGQGVACLLEEDPEKAAALARELDALNRSRREIQQDMQQQANGILAAMRGLQQQSDLPPVLCLYQSDWHEGVIGILAGRIKEQCHRPAIVFTQGQDGVLKGSARSVAGVHIRDLLAAVASRHPGLLDRFGGHAMAAGLSLPEAHYEAFRQALAAVAEDWIAPELLERLVETDGELAVEELTLHSALAIREGGPWGMAFPEPLFQGEFEVLESRLLGGRHLKMKLSDPRDRRILEAIAFFCSEEPQPGSRVRLVYRLDANHFNGVTRLQLQVEHVLSPAAG